jgi:5-dehydro-4-deoxyglucarate dehydratase
VSTLDGVLFFPVTPFDGANRLNLEVLAEHVRQGVADGAGGVFVACGTGEFHALDGAEHAAAVRCAVEATAGRVPVFAGAGGPLPVAVGQVRAAQQAGADGILLLPPYLVDSPPAGLVAYTAHIAAASELAVIVYNRGNAIYPPAAAVEVAALPTVVGLKDGRGDLDLMTRIVSAVRASPHGTGFQFFNGLPTAELTVPAYRAIGVALYSSAVFCFAPDISLAFYAAVERGDQPVIDRLIAGFFAPLVALRNEVPGYAVALVKAAVRMGGLDVGGVRAPLVDPTPAHLERLARIIRDGRALLAGQGQPG